MDKDLTVSQLDRQNILNNDLAIAEIQKQIRIQGIYFEDKLCFTKDMVAAFFEVELRTVERYVSENQKEISGNGYEVLKGKRLKELFDFRAFLNLAMLLGESPAAKSLRQVMLDIVIDFVNQKAGGATKYINQSDNDFIEAFLQEENDCKEFTDALRDYVDMGNAKYRIYTDKIYQSIFHDKANEYKLILKLSSKDRVRDTFYSEIRTQIASYECGLAELIKQQSERLGRKLNNWELSDLFKAFESLPLWQPLIIQVRSKMASRDMALRDDFHYPLEADIKPLEKDEYERLLCAASAELDKLMSENQDVLRRLKESE